MLLSYLIYALFWGSIVCPIVVFALGFVMPLVAAVRGH